MALEQTRATPAAEIKGDQAGLNQQNILTLVLSKQTWTTLHNWAINNLGKAFLNNLIPWKCPTADNWSSSPSSVNSPQHFQSSQVHTPTQLKSHASHRIEMFNSAMIFRP